MEKEIEKNILEILEKGRFENSVFFLPSEQLERKTYLKVNEVLENAGGKWSRKDKGHIFQSDPRKLWKALKTGETVNEKKLYQFFETPKDVVKKIIELAEIENHTTVLEPSAGHGAICEEIDGALDIGLICIEIDPEKCEVLKEKNYRVENDDFLKYGTENCPKITPQTTDEEIKYCLGSFERIVMNPPFTKGQDATHILHAYKLLAEGGRLVSVMSNSVTFNKQKKYQQVRDLIEKKGEIIKLPSDSFKESGTKIETVLVVLDK